MQADGADREQGGSDSGVRARAVGSVLRFHQSAVRVLLREGLVAGDRSRVGEKGEGGAGEARRGSQQ